MTSRNINVLMTGNATQLRTTLAAAGNDVAAFDKKVESSGGRGARAFQVLSTAAKAGGVIIAASLAYGVAQAIKFEAAMRNVNSITGLSESALAALSDQVRQMSLDLPQSSLELAEGLYDISSSGFQGAEALMVLEAAAISASAGLTTTEVSAKGIVAVLNAYGLEATDAAHVSNVLFTAVDVGVVSFEELAGTMGDFVGTAAAAGISVDDAASALATMTLTGISANEAGTSLNRTIQSLLQPGDNLAEVFDSWGYESGEAAIEALGLEGVMGKLREQTGGNVTALLELFPEIRAARGAMSLMANEGENYARVSEAMKNADEGQGAAKETLAEQMKSVTAQWQLFVNWVNYGLTEVGSRFLPVLMAMISGAEDLGKALINIGTGAAAKLETFFGAIVSTGGHLADILVMVWEVVQPLAGGLAALAAVPVAAALNGMAVALEAVAGFLADNEALVKGFVVALVALGAVKAVQALAAQFELMYVAARIGLMDAGTGLANLVKGIGPATIAVAAIGAAAAAGFALWGDEAEKADKKIKRLADGVDRNSIPALQSLARELRDAAKESESWTDNMADVFGGSQSSTFTREAERTEAEFRKLVDTYREVDRIRKEVYDHKPDFAIEEWVDRLDLDPATQSAEEMAEAIDLARAAAVAADPQMQALAEAAAVVGDDYSTAADRVDAFKDAIDAVLGIPKNLMDETVAWHQALSDILPTMAEIKAEGGVSLDPLTQAGRDTHSAFSDLLDQATATADALADAGDVEGARGVYEDYRDTIYKLGEAFGLSRKEVEDWLRDMGVLDAIEVAPKLDTSDVVEGLREFQDVAWKAKEEIAATPIELFIDTSQVTSEMRVLDFGFAAYMQQKPEAKAYLDIEDPEQKARMLQAFITDWSETNPEAKAYLDAMSAEDRFVFLSGLADKWSATKPEAEARADIRNAWEGLTTVEKLARFWDRRTATGTANVNDRASGKLNWITSLANRWGRTSKTANVYAKAHTDEADRKLDNATRDRTVNIWTRTFGSLFGSRWGNVVTTDYASGGIHAHVARGEVLRYAEPETGGEAFIPRIGNRQRSMAILDHAADWYDADVVPRSFAAGGVVGGPRGSAGYSGGGDTYVFSPEVKVNGDDRDLGRKIVKELERNYDDFVKVVRKKEAVR